MTDEQIQKLIQKNNELLLILGYAAGLLCGLEPYIDKERYDWIMDAITNAAYQDKPIPRIT